ncbi:MAG TPA: GDSL-type esterase/lipase family protein, partial [Candidatus Sulfotelmatobacter sp.]|nr:GDSL-type esterase/lipase family protein [Candidatus Sulfotelmatobacter sp.]
RDVLVHAPRLTVVELGGNDFLRRVPVAETIANLDAIVARLTSAGSMVVLLEINVGLLGDPYLAGYRELAARHRALLIPDILQGILTDPGLRVDAIHPNAKGHQRVATRVAPVLRDLLRAADRHRGRSPQKAFGGRFPVAALRGYRVDSSHGRPASRPA